MEALGKLKYSSLTSVSDIPSFMFHIKASQIYLRDTFSYFVKGDNCYLEKKDTSQK